MGIGAAINQISNYLSLILFLIPEYLNIRTVLLLNIDFTKLVESSGKQVK